MPTLDRDSLLAFMRQEPYAIQASVAHDHTPQAAIVGVIVTDRFEIFFDTLADSRKCVNLRRHPVVALVMGPAASGSARTVQLQGLADEPVGADLDRLLALYFERFPDGLQRRQLPGITYWRVRPTWIRDSDFSIDPPQIREWMPTEARIDSRSSTPA